MLRFTIVACIALGATLAVAQDFPPDIPLFSDVVGGPDQINLADLSIHYSVPVFSRSGRGAPFSWSTGFNNVVWTHPSTEWVAFFAGATDLGGVPYIFQSPTCIDSSGATVHYHSWQIIAFQEIEGTTHPFGILLENGSNDGSCPPPRTSATALAQDASGISMTAQ
jgi:hypothetical protein